jgi:hypothetical protein
MELSDATEKTPATPGIDPGTFRLVAQFLNHCATPGPFEGNIYDKICRCVQAPRQEKVEDVETELQVFFTSTLEEGGFQIRAV